MKHLRLFKDRDEFNAADLEYPTLSLIQEDNSTITDETPPTIIAKYVLEEDISEGNFVFYSEVDGDNMPIPRSFTSFEVNGEEMIINNPIINLGSIIPTALSLDTSPYFSEDSFIPAAAEYVEVTTSKPIEYLGYYVPSIGGDLLVGPISEVPGSIIPEHGDNYIRFNCSNFFSLIGEPQDFVLFFADSGTPESIEEINSYTPVINSYSGGISLDANLRSWPAGEYTIKMEFDRRDWKQFNGFFCYNPHLREIYCKGNFSNGIYSEGFFQGAHHLHHVSIFSKNFIDRLEDSFFLDCFGLTTVILPESVTSIGDYAFYGCSSLTSINIPESVISIGNFAFEACSSLTSINIPESVISIGSSAFNGCSLISITIPESVMSIGDLAFYNCRSLTSITCKAVTPPTIGNSNTFYNVDKSIPIYVPTSSINAYKTAFGWKDFTNIQAIS